MSDKLLTEILNQPISWIKGDKGKGTHTYLTEPCQRKLEKQILAKMREVVEGVENPYGHRVYDYQAQKEGWEQARQAILRAIE